MIDKRKDEMPCPDIKKHTPMPDSYIGRANWMEDKSKTHEPILCHGCQRYAIWRKK